MINNNNNNNVLYVLIFDWLWHMGTSNLSDIDVRITVCKNTIKLRLHAVGMLYARVSVYYAVRVWWSLVAFVYNAQ